MPIVLLATLGTNVVIGPVVMATGPEGAIAWRIAIGSLGQEAYGPEDQDRWRLVLSGRSRRRRLNNLRIFSTCLHTWLPPKDLRNASTGGLRAQPPRVS